MTGTTSCRPCLTTSPTERPSRNLATSPPSLAYSDRHDVGTRFVNSLPTELAENVKQSAVSFCPPVCPSVRSFVTALYLLNRLTSELEFLCVWVMSDLPMYPSGQSTQALCAVERHALRSRVSTSVRLLKNYFK